MDDQPKQKATGTPAHSLPSHVEEMDASADTPEDRDGLVEIREGTLHLNPPSGQGAVPTVEPGPGVHLRVAGEPAAGRIPVHSLDDLEIILPQETAESRLEVEVTADRMAAYLTWVVQPARTWRLRQHPPAPHLVLQAEVAGEEPLPKLTPQDVVQALRQEGVLYGLLDAAIAQVPQQPNRRIKVAEGVPPKEPKDGRIRIPVIEAARAREEELKSQAEHAQRLELIREMAIPSVMAGEVAAYCEPPEPGVPGRNVHGDEVPARAPRSVTLTAGSGCRVEGGRVAYAEQTGRPELRGDVIQIIPLHEIRGDLTAKRGHVRFDGDIVVGGNVTESVRIESGGQIRIMGSASGATLAALTGIVVQRAAISSQLVAGGSYAFAAELQGPLEDGVRLLSELQGMVAQVQRRLREQGRPSLGAPPTERALVERLLHLKFRQLPERLAQLGKKLMEHPSLLSEQDQVLAQRLVRGVGLGIRDGSLLPLQEPIHQLDAIRRQLQHHPARSASITVDSLQNSRLIASGTLQVTGKAIYNSQVFARLGVQAHGAQLIGGSLRVQSGQIHLNSVGAEAGTMTHLEIVEDGVLHAQRILPNVQIRIGKGTRRIEQEVERVRVRLDKEGEIVVEPDR